MAETLTGGAAIVAGLERHSVQTVFGLPGAQIYPLFDALAEAGIDVIVPRHEQTAAYMAMGYARSTGNLGVCAVVPGPGVLNASAALCTAMGNCSPVLCLTGQVPSEYLGRGRGHLHELADQIATLKSIIKDAVRIDDPRGSIPIVDRAIGTARSGRPGPVSVEMCWDTMAQRFPADELVGGESPSEPVAALEPDLSAIDEAAALIRASRKPMIMCGAGALDASAEVLALAERLDAPVTAFRSGRGVVAEDHPLGVASVAARELWDDTDLLIGVGSRLEMPYMRWASGMRYVRKPGNGRKLIRIDIDPAEMDRLVPDVGVVADAAAALRALVDGLGAAPRPNPERRAEIASAKALADNLIRKIRPEADFLTAIRDVLPRAGFLVPELSQAGFTSYTGAFPVLAPRTYVTEGFQGTLGFGFPTALGVKVANPQKYVVSITGDGGFMFASQELATAAQYDIGLVTVVFNNGSYGNVLRDQQTQYAGRIVGAKLENPDFLRFAESFGVRASRVATPDALRGALQSAFESGGPSLIEVPLERGSEASPWPLIHMSDRPSRLNI